MGNPIDEAVEFSITTAPTAVQELIWQELLWPLEGRRTRMLSALLDRRDDDGA